MKDTTDKTSIIYEKIPVYKLKGHGALSDRLIEVKDKVFRLLILKIEQDEIFDISEEEAKESIKKFIKSENLKEQENNLILEEIINEMFGLGPIEPLLHDPDISDILVNRYDEIYIERNGKIEKTEIKFSNESTVLSLAQRIVRGTIGRRVDEESPMVDARLKDGSRVNIIIPPVSLEGTSISIRRFSAAGITIDDILKKNLVSEKVCSFLKLIVACRLNIIVSGGTGSGKTTLLNVLSQLISPRNRIITIEDSAELKFLQEHVIRLESRPPNIEGRGKVSIRDLVKNSLRMRPDRIIVGECRGGEAFDMLQAMNTGHDGSMSTLHANSPKEALHRIENMVLMGEAGLPPDVIKGYIAGAIDLVIHIARLHDGSRRIQKITEIKKFEGGEIEKQDIFVFKYVGVDSNGGIIGDYDCVNQDIGFLHKVKYFDLEKDFKECLK